MTPDKRKKVLDTINELKRLNFSINGITIDDIIEAIGRKDFQDEPQDRCIDDMISEILLETGIHKFSDGYQYLACSIKFLLDKNLDTIRSIERDVYPEVIKKYGVSLKRVSREIEREINQGWSKMDIDTECKYFDTYRKPIARNFIISLVKVLKQS